MAGEGGSSGSARSVGGLYAGGVAEVAPEGWWWWGGTQLNGERWSCRLVLYVERVAEPRLLLPQLSFCTSTILRKKSANLSPASRQVRRRLSDKRPRSWRCFRFPSRRSRSGPAPAPPRGSGARARVCGRGRVGKDRRRDPEARLARPPPPWPPAPTRSARLSHDQGDPHLQ